MPLRPRVSNPHLLRLASCQSITNPLNSAQGTLYHTRPSYKQPSSCLAECFLEIENIMKSGRESRKDRLTVTHVGAWSTSAQDYVHLATKLFFNSASESAASSRSNASSYVFAGLPLLFSALRAFLIECNSGAYGVESDKKALARLAKDPNELDLLRDNYALRSDLLEKLSLLYEARNEIIHPSHRPCGTTDSTPEYIRPLKELGVLETTNAASDYPWMFQLQSHQLFLFAFSLIEQIIAAIIVAHTARDAHFQCQNLTTYVRYRQN